MRTLDPRGIGLNPVVASFYDLLPAGNDTSRRRRSQHDPVHGRSRFIVQQRHLVLRLDRNVSTNWRADVNYRFGSIRETRCRTGGHQRSAAWQRARASRSRSKTCRASRVSWPAASPVSSRRGSSTKHASRTCAAYLAFTRVESVPAGAGHQRRDGRRRRRRADRRRHRAAHARRSPTSTPIRCQQLDLEPRQAHHSLRRHLAARVLVLQSHRPVGRLADDAGGNGQQRDQLEHSGERRCRRPAARR